MLNKTIKLKEMKATEIRDLIFSTEKELHKISEAIARDIDFDGIDIIYLKSKYTSLLNTAKHIEGQFKFKSKR